MRVRLGGSRASQLLRTCFLIVCVALWFLPAAVRVIAQETDPPAPADAPPNPLSELLNRVFGGGDNPRLPAGGRDNAEDGGNSAPQPGAWSSRSSSSDARQLARAESAAAKGDWLDAVQELQDFLDRPQDALWQRSDGAWVSLQAEVEARIGELPPAGRAVYQAEFGDAAARLLRQAEGPDALRGAAIVANRFYHTDAGKQAAARVASLLLDRGEYRAASAWYARLMNEPAFRNAVDWRAKATYALVQAGEQTLAAPLLESLAQQPARPLVGTAASNDSLAAWIRRQPVQTHGTPQLSEWLNQYGNAAHVGRAPPCVPLLLERWSHPLTARHALEQQLRSLMLDLEDHQRAAIPTLAPIVAGGCVVYRTLHGLAAVDARTGRLLWESEPGVSAERILAHEPPDASGSGWAPDGIVADYNDTNFEQHPLTSLLFRDAGYGLVSSDGRRVYSIENSVLMPPASFGWWGNNSPAQQDPYHRDWSSNQIYAYDLATGVREWEAGGRRTREPFDPPLAGVFFFGPPVAEGGDLFAIGERDGEVLLFVLSPETGDLRWSQALKPPRAVVEQDLVRRLWSATPAVDGGLVVCPTTTGWLVAVDRHTHRIAWAHRFSESTDPPSAASGATVHSMQALNDRWCSTAPILAQGRVLFAPPEHPDETGQDQPRLLCLDVRSGSRVWERPKANFLYVAGVFDECVVLVGRDAVTSLDVAGGAVRWTAAIPADDGPPSGRGIAVGNHYLLPLTSGALWTIDLASGQVVRRDRRPGGDASPPLGNLAVWDGMLISVGPFGATGYEQRAPLEQEIDTRLAADPRDVWAAVRRAEMHTIAGDAGAALQALDRAALDAAAPPSLRDRHRELTFASLLALARADTDNVQPLLERAAVVALGDAERLELARLTADRHIADQHWQAAVELCQSIAADYAPETMIDEPPLQVRLDVWLGGRLADVFAQAPPDVAAALAERVAATLESASLQMPAAASLERIYGFHPVARSFTWRLIEDAAYRKEFAGAEVRLRRLIESGDPATAAAALARLGELLLDCEQPEDAAAAFADLETRYPDVLLPSLQTGAEAARSRFVGGPLDRTTLQPPPLAGWTADRFDVRRYRVINPDYSAPLPAVTRSLDAAFHRRHLLEFDAQSPVLTVLRRSDNGVYWRVPLRTADAAGYHQGAAVVGLGLQSIVLHRGMLHALSLADRKVLWSRPAAERAPQIYARHIYDNDAPNLMPVATFINRLGLRNPHSPTGMLALVTSRYVACYGRGEFVMLDPLTGDVLWRRRGMAPQTGLFGNAQTVFVIPTEPSAAHAVRASDGRPIAIDNLPELVKNSVAVTHTGMVRIERQPANRETGAAPKVTISEVDPFRGNTRWTHDLGSRARLNFLDHARLLILDEVSGACTRLDLQSGELLPLGTVPAGAIGSAEMYAVADARQIYLILNEGGGSNSYVHPPALRINGTIVALAADGAGIAWQQAVDNQNLLLPRFDQSPLLVCLAYDHVHLPDIDADYANARMLVLDKRDGRVVAEETRASPSGNYYRLDVNSADRSIDILSHNERVRIQAVEPPGS